MKLKHRIYLLLIWLMPFMFALTGCATDRVKTVEVKVPVPVTCKTPTPVAPDYPVINKDDGLFVRVQKQLIIDTLRKAYEEKLLAWGGGCNT